MEQFFGVSGSSIIFFKSSDLNFLVFSKGDFDFFSFFFGDKSRRGREYDEDDDFFFGEGRSFNLNRYRLKFVNSKLVVKVVDFVEEEIEEVVLR